MPRLIAFLRAINVGGRNVPMEKLRVLFESCGFSEVETFLASGNVIFNAAFPDSGALERTIEDCLGHALGYEVKAFLRTDLEVEAIARYRPFSDSKTASAAALNVAFLATFLPREAERALRALRSEIDDFHVHGREVYWVCTKKQSESKFSNAVFERVLKVRATFRGLNTVARLAAKYPPMSSKGAMPIGRKPRRE